MLHILKCLFPNVSKLQCFSMDSNCLSLLCSQKTEGTEQTTLADAQAHS